MDCTVRAPMTENLLSRKIGELGGGFSHESEHDLAVMVGDFQACKKPSANEAFTSGHDVIPLNTTGVKWYICGIGEHCAKFNQKLKITVVDDTSSDKKSGADALISSSFKILAGTMVALVLVTVR